MAQKIDKAAVMRRAWRIFKSRGQGFLNAYNDTFANALSRAWYVEKETIAYREREAEKERIRELNRINRQREAAFMDSIRRPDGTVHMEDIQRLWYGRKEGYDSAVAADYANAPRGTYFGD